MPPFKTADIADAGNLSPASLLHAYCAGFFPMASNRSSREIRWYNPPVRGVLPLASFHTPRKLSRICSRPEKEGGFTIRCNTSFEATIRACAAWTPKRTGSWINEDIVVAYCRLHELGFAHSVEAWSKDRLLGGLYGVQIKRAFFGESMFSHVRDASKVALVHLAARLDHSGILLFDTQYATEHLAHFGVVEIQRAAYRKKLSTALTQGETDFHRELDEASLLAFLHRTSQTS